jgi:hypothetical protein
MELSEMVEEMNENTNKRKILMPIATPKPILRPVPTIRPLANSNAPSDNTMPEHSNTPVRGSNDSSKTLEVKNMSHTEQKPNALQLAIDRALKQEPQEEIQAATISSPPLTPPKIEAQPTPTHSQPPVAMNRAVGTGFFKFPGRELPMGRGVNALRWGPLGSSSYEELRVTGSPIDYIRHCNWHLHGASVWMGTSATGVTEAVGVNPATGVTGFIPQAVKHISELVRTSRRFSENRGLDGDGNEYQFGVVAVLGGQDHSALLRQVKNVQNNAAFAEAFRSIGAPQATLKAALFNDMGKVFALELNLGSPGQFGRGRHLIFIHPANDIGGGKSDESLVEGRLGAQCKALADEFVWWQAALERVGGKIGSIETTLGGTARIGRYAMLSSRIPRSIIAKDAFESINIDRGDWIQENLQSQLQEYRANFATTLLRTTWGRFGERLQGFPVILTDRHNASTQQVNKIRAQIAILRSLFLGHTELDLLQGDISDERIAKRREEAITESQYMTIHDTVETDPQGPWDQQRRLRMNSTLRISQAKMVSLARSEDPSQNIDYAQQIISEMRGLATSAEATLPAGGFVVIDALVPSHLLEDDRVAITKSTVSRAVEAIAQGLVSEGIDKPLINLYKIPTGVGLKRDDIMIQITEDQPGTNVLIVATEEVNPSKKRRIVSNPETKKISNPYGLVVSAFHRLLLRMVNAHKQSGYHHCIVDGDLMMAFFRHYYGGAFGNRPNLILGGSDRLRNKIEGKGE